MVLDLQDIESAIFTLKNQNNLSDNHKTILNFLIKWQSNSTYFNFFTSGSTGNPKEIIISKDILAYSATQTLNYLNISDFSNLLLCLPPQFIGGTMVLVRTILNKSKLYIIDSHKDIQSLNDKITLASMLPLQIKWIIENSHNKIDLFENILIGGTELSNELEENILKLQLNSKIFATFGMTETASHIALRKLGEPTFKSISDVFFDVDDENCLKLKGTLTDHKWLQTNDIVDLINNKEFTWKGRRDLIINSGGLKFSPEQIEKKIILERKFFVSSLNDKTLGQKIVLVIEGQPFKIDLSKFNLSKYEKPKEVYFLNEFNYTSSGKINRIETKKILLMVC